MNDATRQACQGPPPTGLPCPYEPVYRLTLGDVPGHRLVVCVRHLRSSVDHLHTIGKEVRTRRI